METIVADITCNPKEDEKIYEKAGEILRAGGLVAFPTETVYGLGGNALQMHLMKRHRQRYMRQREDHPIIRL